MSTRRSTASFISAICLCVVAVQVQGADSVSAPLYFAKQEGDGIWQTRYKIVAGVSSFEEPTLYMKAPTVTFGGNSIVFPILSFAVFQRSNDITFVYAASGIDFFEFDGITWSRRGALGGTTGNNITAAAIDAQGRLWMTGNPDPSGTFVYTRGEGNLVRQLPDYSSYGGMTADKSGDSQYLLLGSIPASPLTVYESTEGQAWKAVTALTADEVVLEGSKEKTLDRKLHPAFTHIRIVDATKHVTIGWSNAANTGSGYKSRFVQCKFQDLLKHKSGEDLKCIELCNPVSLQLHGMTVLPDGDVIAAFYGGQIRNVTNDKCPPINTGSGYAKWIQQATILP